jgi:molecular chaperone DnaJ
MDPYSILGVSASASDEEIKKAYRDLVKKYHPDKYRDSDLNDLAEEKLKSINKAYDDIVRMRKDGGGYNTNPSGGGYSYNNYAGAGSASFARIRSMIQMRQLNQAEKELDAMTNQNAEWHYLKGVICMQRGWADGAKEHFKKATDMAPSNQEYRQAYNAIFNQNQNYQNFYGGGNKGGMSPCSCCTCALCSDCCCECFGADLIGCC